MCVEGTAVIVETDNGKTSTYAYGETFIIPSFIKKYKLRTIDDKEIKVILSYCK